MIPTRKRHIPASDQHIYHHHDKQEVSVTVTFEKNTKGYNYGATVSGVATVDEAINLLMLAKLQLQQKLDGEPAS
jgi:hypothetical protein